MKELSNCYPETPNLLVNSQSLLCIHRWYLSQGYRLSRNRYLFCIWSYRYRTQCTWMAERECIRAFPIWFPFWSFYFIFIFFYNIKLSTFPFLQIYIYFNWLLHIDQITKTHWNNAYQFVSNHQIFKKFGF